MYKFVFADDEGNGYIDEKYLALGRLGDSFVEFADDEVIPLPEGASLTMIPNRTAVVMDKKGNFKRYDGQGWVMGALLPQGYTRTLLPAFIDDGTQEPLPLFGYAAVCAKGEEFYVAAMQTDEDRKWNPKFYHTQDLPRLVAKMKGDFPQNRLVEHLGHCALEYGCFTAQNIFYHRWEGGIPVSPACNARCVGCISEQESECCPAPQSRLKFVPTVDEVAQLLQYHLKDSEEGIISFGQGCEGDPSLQCDLVAAAIKKTRANVANGTINMNTNAGYTAGIEKLIAAGIDSFRVSLNSGSKDVYEAYYRPVNYRFENVKNSLKAAAKAGVYTYLNLLFYPGINDCEGEVESLLALVEECDVKAIQIRNLNIDPLMIKHVQEKTKGDALGVPAFVQILQEELPNVAIGNYTKPLR